MITHGLFQNSNDLYFFITIPNLLNICNLLIILTNEEAMIVGDVVRVFNFK